MGRLFYGIFSMALLAEKNVLVLTRWLKLRRLAFRFDRKTKVGCLLALIVPGMASIGSTWMVALTVVFASAVYLILPVFTGAQTLSVIRERFGTAVAVEALERCSFARYHRDRTFTIGDIQRALASTAERDVTP